jgi:hypothetical protein
MTEPLLDTIRALLKKRHLLFSLKKCVEKPIPKNGPMDEVGNYDTIIFVPILSTVL